MGKKEAKDQRIIFCKYEILFFSAKTVYQMIIHKTASLQISVTNGSPEELKHYELHKQQSTSRSINRV